MTGDLGASLSLWNSFSVFYNLKVNIVCAKYICTYMYVHAGMHVCTCVHVWVRGESTVLQPFQAEGSQLSS